MTHHSTSTADRILEALRSYRLKDNKNGTYISDIPWRPGSDSRALSLKIKDGEHGTWFDFVTREGGSLYELAQKIGVSLPEREQPAMENTKRKYSDLADYAQAHGIPAEALRAAGWAQTTKSRRPALCFPTASGSRWRFIDGEQPSYINPVGYVGAWYRLDSALDILSKADQPLVLCNGEISTVAAQWHGVAATCVSGGGEKDIPPALLLALQEHYPTTRGPILIALDCDRRGREAAQSLETQLRGAGYTAHVLDLGGSHGFDLADFCALHRDESVDELRAKVTETEHQAVETPQTRSGMIIETLTRLGYSFRLNLCSDTVEVNGVAIDDIIAARIRMEMRDLDIRPLAAAEDAYVTEAARNAYHPIKDYLNSISWDGADHIGALSKKLLSDDPSVAYEDGSAQPLVAVYLRRWLVGAVAKIFDQHQNVMLVLAGPQGIGKSAWVRWLCRSIPAYFIEAPINVNDKDSDVRLMSRFIWEVSELDATTRKADVSALKGFITRETVTVRKSYGRHDTVKPALASMIGTVNEGSGFLSDETGNRRFMVASIQFIDWSYQTIDVDQVWAQAVALYRKGEAWRLSQNEAAIQAEQNKNYEVESALEGWILRYFDFGETVSPYAKLTASEIIDHLRANDVRLSGNPRADAMEISRVLTRLGVEKVRTSTWRGYINITPRMTSQAVNDND